MTELLTKEYKELFYQAVKKGQVFSIFEKKA